MYIDIYIKDFYVKNKNGRLHIINIKDRMFSVCPRTNGIVVPTQNLKSIDIANGEISLTGMDDITHSYTLL